MRLGASLLLCASMILAASALAPLRVPAFAKSTVEDVSQGLTCQCGCGLTVANCNHPNCSFSVPVKEQIDGMLRKGMSGAAVIAFFRHKYGEKVLSAPTTEGFNILAWITPFAALALGAGFIMLLFARWRRATPSLPAGPEQAGEQLPVIDPKLREELENEVREQL